MAGVPTHVTVMLSWTLDTRHQMQINFFCPQEIFHADRCVHPCSSQGYSCLPAAPYYGLPSGLVLVFNDLTHVSLLRTLQGLDRTTTLFLSFPSIVRGTDKMILADVITSYIKFFFFFEDVRLYHPSL